MNQAIEVSEVAVRQKAIFDFIVNFKRAHDGCSPTIAEIGRHIGVESNSLVDYYLRGLVRMGAIRRKRGARMIQVTGGSWSCRQNVTN